MFKFIDVDQNSDEWFELRAGKATSSKFPTVMASPRDYMICEISKGEFAIINLITKKAYKTKYEAKYLAEAALIEMKTADLVKSFGVPANQYAVNIAIEQITGNPIASTFTNAHMDRGHEEEPIARNLYEENKFTDVTNGGFFDCGFVGCSPDGLVGTDGVIEIKSVIASVQFANIKRQKIDPAYYWQCVGNLKFTERNWLDFISYSSDFPIDNQLFIHRIHAADLSDEFEKIDVRIAEFKKLVAQSKEIILNN